MKLKKFLIIALFIIVIYGLKYWLGFEAMVTIVICAWFSTIIEVKEKL